MDHYIIKHEVLKTGTRFNSYESNILEFDSIAEAYDYIHKYFCDNELGKDILDEKEFNSESPLMEQTSRLINFVDGTIGLEIFTITRLNKL